MRALLWRLRLALADDVDRLRLAGPRLALGRAAVEDRRLGPALVERPSSGTLHRLRLLAGQLEQRAEHAGIARCRACSQRAEDGVEDVRHLAQEGARLARRLGRHELQHHRQVVGQLAFGQVQAGLLVGLRQVDHRRAAVARVAVHVLEQVQRGARGRGRTAPRSRPRRRARSARARLSISASSSASARRLTARASSRSSVAHLGQVLAQRARRGSRAARASTRRLLRHAVGVVEREHGQTSALMGMVRFFSLPNRLVSLMPSEQPLPKREAAAAAHVEGVLGVLAVRARDDEAVLVVGDRHHVVHVLDLGLRSGRPASAPPG